MKLSSLLSFLLEKEVFNLRDVEIKNITDNSRDIKEGSLFVAIKGEKFDGHSFIQEAINKGASCIVVEDKKYITPNSIFVLTFSSLKALSQLASAFFGNPSDSLNIIGITGTNGKTTTAFLIEEVFKKASFPIARLGTIGHRIGSEDIPTVLTTPHPLEIFKLLLKAKNEGAKFVVMEVSSHGLSLERVSGIKFKQAIFTNLTEDHLDFHKTWDSYLLAKKRLFLSLNKDCDAFVNIDDPSYKKIISGTKARVITYGINGNADIKGEKIKEGKRGISFSIGKERINTLLYGTYNIYNCLASISCAIMNGISFDVIKDAISNFKAPLGRFEIIWKSPLVVIDYAHTPDGLSCVLKTAKSLIHKRIILVFGCGGNREKQKRPIMGKIASSLSDIPIITSDNPRDEDPEIIMDEIEKGMKKAHLRIVNRETAIKKAIELADKDDLILIAGKGHEDYQIIGNERIPFNDKEVALKILKNSKLKTKNAKPQFKI
ncbi:MAG: UDP-N-acetylmuramoyl-L-alanyl-D-glutamate--2,6-diaminopimelate ligase [bacterium]